LPLPFEAVRFFGVLDRVVVFFFCGLSLGRGALFCRSFFLCCLFLCLRFGGCGLLFRASLLGRGLLLLGLFLGITLLFLFDGARARRRFGARLLRRVLARFVRAETEALLVLEEDTGIDPATEGHTE